MRAVTVKGTRVTTISARPPARQRSRTEAGGAPPSLPAARSASVRCTHHASRTARAMSTRRRFRLSRRSLRIPGIRYISRAKGVWLPREERTPMTRIPYQIHHCRASGRRRHRLRNRQQAAMRARIPT